METDLRRTWTEIDLDHLLYNYHALRRRVGMGVKFLGVVKADAYGHGGPDAAGCRSRLPGRIQSG